MRARAVGTVALLGVLGLAAGYAGASLTGTGTVETGTARPVPAERPSVPRPALAPPPDPGTPASPYADDVTFPTLRPDLAYVPRLVGEPPDQWGYEAPSGWLTRRIGRAERTCSPPGAPNGGYAVRVKVLDPGAEAQDLAERRLAGLRSDGAEVTVLERDDDTLSVTFRSVPGNRLRYTIFRWLPAGTEAGAGLEVAVNGREQDVPGLVDLLDRVSASAAPT